MFCNQCGRQLVEEAKFCYICGAAAQKPEKHDTQKQQDAQQIVTINDETYVSSLLEYLRDILNCESALIGYESSLQKNREITASFCIRSVIPAPPVPPAYPIEKDPSVTGRAVKAGIATASLFTPAAPIGIIALGIQAHGRNKDKQKAKAAYEHELELYNYNMYMHENSMREYNTMVDAENRRMKAEAVQKQLYEEQAGRIEELITQAKDTLVVLYGTNILHAKYQNLTAVASIYDYLSTGRTASLVRAGNDPGAYNIYEDDVRIGRIITTVGMVGSQIIDAVKNMEQSMRYYNQAVCDAIEDASEIQSSYLSQMSDAVSKGQQAIDVSNQHLKEIAKYERIRTDALRERNANLSLMPVKDKSGYYIDE